jgi:hypothetical protein
VRRKRMRMWRIVCLVALASLVALPTGGDAMRGKKEKLKAKINGKGFKANIRESIVATHDGTTNLVFVSGTSRKGLRKVTVKNFSVSCVAPLEGATFPMTVSECTGAFSIATASIGGSSSTGWAGSGISVTLTSFDGTRLNGTFEGTLPPSELTETPATIVKGKFAVDMQ